MWVAIVGVIGVHRQMPHTTFVHPFSCATRNGSMSVLRCGPPFCRALGAWRASGWWSSVESPYMTPASTDVGFWKLFARKEPTMFCEGHCWAGTSMVTSAMLEVLNRGGPDELPESQWALGGWLDQELVHQVAHLGEHSEGQRLCSQRPGSHLARRIRKCRASALSALLGKRLRKREALDPQARCALVLEEQQQPILASDGPVFSTKPVQLESGEPPAATQCASYTVGLSSCLQGLLVGRKLMQLFLFASFAQPMCWVQHPHQLWLLQGLCHRPPLEGKRSGPQSPSLDGWQQLLRLHPLPPLCFLQHGL